MGKLCRDRRGGLDKDVVSLHSADIANSRNYGCARRFSGHEGCIPVSNVNTVVDRLYQRRLDSIHSDAMLADLLGDGKDSIGNAGHEAISNVVFAGPEDSHISTAPDKLGIGQGLRYKSRPEIRALKKCLNNLDSMLFEESPQFQGSPQCCKIVGTLQ